MVEQVYIRVDYNLELLKVVLTNITKVKIRYLGKIIKFCLRLGLFLELLLKIPDGFRVFSSPPFLTQIGLCVEARLILFIAHHKINTPIGQSLPLIGYSAITMAKLYRAFITPERRCGKVWPSKGHHGGVLYICFD